jgi:hypothetical protein
VADDADAVPGPVHDVVAESGVFDHPLGRGVGAGNRVPNDHLFAGGDAGGVLGLYATPSG